MFQNLAYFWKKKTQTKKLHIWVFSFLIPKIWKIIEAFPWNFSLSTNLEIVRCAHNDPKFSHRNYIQGLRLFMSGANNEITLGR